MRTMFVACLIAAVYAVHESGQTLSSSCQTKLLRAVIDDNCAKGAGSFNVYQIRGPMHVSVLI